MLMYKNTLLQATIVRLYIGGQELSIKLYDAGVQNWCK